MWFKIRGSGFGVQFSPFVADRIAVVSSQNFGIVGRGFATVYHFSPSELTELVVFETKDCLFDCCWSEVHESFLITASADGVIHLFDTAAALPEPISLFHEHSKEVSAVKWNQQRLDVFLSASWDGTAKLWSASSQPTSVQTFTGHQHSVYDVTWNVITPSTFATASGDLTLKVWDDRNPQAALSWIAHQNEVLCVDWCKYDEHRLVSGSVDKSLRLWDTRRTNAPVHQLEGHRYAVKRCRFSPHSPDLVLSCSYDMSVRLWNLTHPPQSQQHQRVWDHHSEFACGIDFSNHEEGRVVSVGWDEKLHTWNLNTSM